MTRSGWSSSSWPPGRRGILDSFNAGSGEVLRPIQQIAVFGAGAFGTFSIIVFLSLYMAADGARLQGSFRRLFPARFEADIAHFESSVARSFGGFIRGQVILGLFYGAIAFITCFALHLPFLPLVVVTVAVLHMIPFFGPFFSWAPPVVVAVFFVPAAAFPAFVVMGISMLLLMNLVQPRLMGDAVGLHPVAVLGSVLIGAKLAGVLGAIFAVPVAAVIAAVITQWRTRMFAAAVVSEAGEVDAAAASPDAERGRPVAGADVRRSPQPGSLVSEPAFVTRFANAVRWWFGGNATGAAGSIDLGGTAGPALVGNAPGRIKSFAASREAVWSYLVDPTRLSPCSPVPITRLDDRHYRATAQLGSGLFSATLVLDLEADDVQPLDHIRLVGRGGASGTTIDSTSTFTLRDGPAPDAPATTVLDWDLELTLTGMFAATGAKIIADRAPEAIRQLVTCVRGLVTG